MKASLFTPAGLLVCGFATAQAASVRPTGNQATMQAGVATAPIALARNGADNPPGDDHGGRGGNGRGGHDDGAHPG